MTPRVTTASADIAYIERGRPDAPPVLLVHGFPDNPLTWHRVAMQLAANGYRAIAPFVRGFGLTQLHPSEPRTGEIGALVNDVFELLDALGLEQVHYIGHDWGARAGYAAASIAPERFLSLTALAVAYGTNVASQTLSIAQTRAYWYQWYFATPRGAAELEGNRDAFCRALWQLWSPGWQFNDDDFEATALSFANPDFVPVVLSSYRQRWGFIPGEPAYAQRREAIERVAPIDVDTLVLMGADDGATLPDSADGKEHLFRGRYQRHLIDRCGHFIARERPDEVMDRWLAFVDRRS